MLICWSEGPPISQLTSQIPPSRQSPNLPSLSIEPGLGVRVHIMAANRQSLFLETVANIAVISRPCHSTDQHHCSDHNAVEGETRFLTPESVLSTYELALRDPVINTGASANSSPFAWQESFWAGGRLKCPTFDQFTSGNYFFHAQPHTPHTFTPWKLPQMPRIVSSGL